MSAMSLSRSGRIQSSSSNDSHRKNRNAVTCEGRRRRAVIPRAAVHDSSGQSRDRGTRGGCCCFIRWAQTADSTSRLALTVVGQQDCVLGNAVGPGCDELIIAELLYLQHKDRSKPIYLYINSTGTTRADGETVGFETEGTAIYDAMTFVKNEIHTVGVGVAIGQACMLLSAGEKGKRFMLEHATAMMHQPRVPPTGQRQAIEVEIKWREVLAQKQNLLEIMSRTTGHDTEKLEKDIQRPLYMQPKDALAYGIIDGIVSPEKQIIDQVKSAEQWDKDAGLVAR
eukprot:jgi/Picre1/33617/NNA_001097.t1